MLAYGDRMAASVDTEEATALLAACQRGLAADFPGLAGWEFATGVSYRNLLLHRGRAGEGRGVERFNRHRQAGG